MAGPTHIYVIVASNVPTTIAGHNVGVTPTDISLNCVADSLIDGYAPQSGGQTASTWLSAMSDKSAAYFRPSDMPGYIFAGWRTLKVDTQQRWYPTLAQVESDSTGMAIANVASDLTYQAIEASAKKVTTGNNRTYYVCYAFYYRTLVTVTFNANGGTGGTQVTNYYGEPLTAPTVSRTGHTFTGWSPSVPSTMPAANTTYVAQWTPNEYTITFDASGGTGGTQVRQYYGTALTAPTVSLTGCTFLGWYPSVPATVPAADTTYYAQWALNTYTVTFNANGGYTSPRTASVTYSMSYGTLPTPTRTGYTFVGWYTAATGGTQVTAVTQVTTPADHSIYAHWLKDEICVFLDPNGGDIAPSSLWVNVATGVYPALPTATGLVGWFTASTGGAQKTQGSALAESADHTLYAHWTVTHTLTLRDAANSSVSTRTVAEGSAYGPLPSPTRTGYTFAGWWTGTVSGSQVSAATTMGDRDVTIYARWTPTALTITFDVNGGTAISPSSRTALYGQQYGTLQKAKKTVKKFDGWWTAATGGTEITATTIATSSLTVYAHWRDPAFVPLGYISTSGS